jgi:poly(3-hydroxybutyrate) depolymerase
MNLRKSFVLGVTASLTALTLSCSDSQSDSSGAGGMTQTGNGGGSTAGASIGGSMGGSLMGGAPGSGGTTSAATGGSAQGGAAQGGASAQPTGGSDTNGGATAAGAANGGGNAGGGTKASGGSATGGSANNGGTAGAVGNGTGGGGSTAKRSAGCEKATTQKLDDWVDSMVLTSGANRPYSVRLPSKYDPTRAYPVVVLLHGCGSGTNNVPMEKATGSDAILVRGTGSAASTCWDTSANGKDVAFFDSMVADVKARFCTDESRVFIVGYSSGSWLVNQLTCIRADVVRGGASVSGGESSNGKCGGPVARIFLHDTTDMDNQISGSEKARDRQLTQNMCDKSAAPVAVDPSPCKAYQGCKDGYPVEWCQTSGNGHGRQDSFAPSTFWNFFKGL